MEPLPDIEVLSFLNWMDQNGYPDRLVGGTIDELFLNDACQEQVLELERTYLEHLRSRRGSRNSQACEQYVDYMLGAIRSRIMDEYSRDGYRLTRLWDSGPMGANRLFFERLEQAAHTLAAAEHPISLPSPRQIGCGDLSEYIRHCLTASEDSAVTGYFTGRSNTIAGIARSFLVWAGQQRKLRGMNLKKVPAAVLENYIDTYVWERHSREYMSPGREEKIRSVLQDAFIAGKYDHYLGSVFAGSDLSHVTERSFNRYVRFKCTLLATDDTFIKLVRDFWGELNDLTGDHLDIYYSEAELAQRGYRTADRLDIRDRIDAYPCIYLWEYDLHRGVCIPVTGLDAGDLRDIFQVMVDAIIEKHTLADIADTARQKAEAIRLTRERESGAEAAFTTALLNACARMQQSRFWTSRIREEDGRNKYIINQLRAGGYITMDQPQNGLSPAGNGPGENDMTVYTQGGQPFTIIEALNIRPDRDGNWSRSNFRYHLNKIYDYDSNGLPRNYLLMYVEMPHFDGFWRAMLEQVAYSRKCTFGSAELIGLTERPEQGYTDLRLATARYRRNGKTVNVHLIAMLVDGKTGKSEIQR